MSSEAGDMFVCVCGRSQASTGAQAKQEGLREEVEEAWRKLECIKVRAPRVLEKGTEPPPLPSVKSTVYSGCFLSLQDQYSADLYHFATKEDDYANYFIRVSCSCDT